MAHPVCPNFVVAQICYIKYNVKLKALSEQQIPPACNMVINKFIYIFIFFFLIIF